MLAVNRAYREQLLELFTRIDTYSAPAASSPLAGIEDRMLKQVLLDLIAIDDTTDSHRLIVEHFHAAATAQDRVAALLALNRSSAPLRRSVLEQVYAAWHDHLSGYANYLRIIASGTQPDVFTMIAEEKARAGFDITQPTWCRALFLPMAVNTKMVWTSRGIDWVVATVSELAPINATTASRLLNSFQQVRKLKPDLQARVEEALKAILTRVSESVSPTIHGQAQAYLGNR
jgi:aminopeptidase N